LHVAFVVIVIVVILSVVVIVGVVGFAVVDVVGVCGAVVVDVVATTPWVVICAVYIVVVVAGVDVGCMLCYDVVGGVVVVLRVTGVVAVGVGVTIREYVAVRRYIVRIGVAVVVALPLLLLRMLLILMYLFHI